MFGLLLKATNVPCQGCETLTDMAVKSATMQHTCTLQTHQNQDLKNQTKKRKEKKKKGMKKHIHTYTTCSTSLLITDMGRQVLSDKCRTTYVTENITFLCDHVLGNNCNLPDSK